jgi:hypothetical protein
MADRYFIGPNDVGQQNNLKPFAIPDNAYESLRNAYVWRGRVRKRFGAKPFSPGAKAVVGAEQLQSRLRVQLAGAVAGDAFHGFVPLLLGVPEVTPAVGQMFSILGTMFTVNVVGAPIANLMRSDGSGLAATFNFVTGAVDILLPPGTVPGGTLVYYYPSLPVMGFTEYELHTINDEQTIAFDTRFAYTVNFNGWTRVGTAVWSGGNSDFFWSTTWRGATTADNLLFTSNFVATDGIRYWNGAAWLGTAWAYFETAHGVFLYIDTARIIVPFDGRLLLMNTIEDGVLYQNRCRFSWKGDPTHTNGAGIEDAFREDDPAIGAGWEDVPVQEAIITVQFLRNRLIVYCERSTWELVPTGVDIRPFIWQQLNTELGAESTFSQIPFDSVVLGVGNVGIHACDGNGVKRVDQQIPDEVFEIHNINDGPNRVCGIRDFFTEMAYWTFPSNANKGTTSPYPDRLLVLNYITGAWAFFDDSITTFGYIQNNINNSDTWEADFGLWMDDSSTWQTANIAAKARNVIAGNQEGYVFLVFSTETTNCFSLQITNIATNSVFTVIDHNLKQGEFIKINDCTGFTTFNNAIHMVESVVDSNTFTLAPIAVAGYTGGGTITRVSKIDILTKRFNFYGDKGMNMALTKVDFLVDSTDNGKLTFEYRLSNTQTDNVVAPGALLGTNVLETSPYALVPMEVDQETFWHAMYPQAQGEFVQLHLTLSDLQMQQWELDAGGKRKFVADNDFQLSGIMALTSPLTRF